MIDELRTNWDAMDAAKKRKAIILLVVAVFIIFAVVSQLVVKSASKRSMSADQSGKEEVIKLGGSPDTDWLEKSIADNAALDREQIRAHARDIEERFVKSEEATGKVLSEVSSGIERIQTSVDMTHIELAKEIANRKAADKLLIQRLESFATNGVSAASPFEAAGGVSAHADGDQGALSFGVQGVPKKVSAFDLLAISQATNTRLSFKSSVEAAPQKKTAEGPEKDRMGHDIDATDLTSAGQGQSSTGKKKAQKKILVTIPSGSLIRARLVSGVDAMVANSANVNNQVTLAKLTDPVLLPNGQKVDLRGCVIMAGVMGEMSTERVYFNSTIVSCMDKKGLAYEGTVKANGLGEDGKLGLRGVLVTRDGALIMKSMQAGLLQGFASAFSNASNTSTVVTDSGSFQLPSGSYVAKTGLASGVSTGLEQMVKRFNNILDQIFPVLQIDSGRLIEFVVQSSFEVKEV